MVSGGIDFAGSGGLLQISGSAMPSAVISGFVPGDTIDLANISGGSAGTANLKSANVLQITEGGLTYDLNLAGNFNAEYFHLAADLGGMGTDITESSQPCYCPGTLILTPQGERPVETLAIGDEVLTAAGTARPIKWIGRRSYSGRFIMGRKNILPICIKAGALADDVPRRDLWISPHHAMYLDGVLIEAINLLNGVSVVQADHAEQVDYFHVELETHDVIIAEGAASESFVEDASRGMFHNAHEFRALYPQHLSAPTRYCAPRLDSGYQVETARERFNARAGLRSAKAPEATLRGHVDLTTPFRIAGWAQSPQYPESPVCLDIYAGGRLLGQVIANRYRADLAQAGLGSGRHSFEFKPPSGVAFDPITVQVRRSSDGAALTAALAARPKAS